MRIRRIPAPKVETMSDSDKFKILYVDDENDNLLGFKATFRREYNVALAQSANEALEVLKKEKFQVIVSDQKMPQISGVEFLKKTLNIAPNTTRILLTGYSDTSDIIEAINKGQIFQFVSKPWEKNELKMILDNAIGNYLLKNENQSLLKQIKTYNENLEELIEKRTQELNMVRMEVSDTQEKLRSANSKHYDQLYTPTHEISKASALLKEQLKGYGDSKVSSALNTLVKASSSLTHILQSFKKSS